MGVGNVLDKDSVVGVEGKPVLVGGGTNGASVNVGNHTGLKAQCNKLCHGFNGHGAMLTARN